MILDPLSSGPASNIARSTYQGFIIYLSSGASECILYRVLGTPSTSVWVMDVVKQVGRIQAYSSMTSPVSQTDSHPVNSSSFQASLCLYRVFPPLCVSLCTEYSEYIQSMRVCACITAYLLCLVCNEWTVWVCATDWFHGHSKLSCGSSPMDALIGEAAI